jgi:50S ribosomal subunit-associated GTPase HflX
MADLVSLLDLADLAIVRSVEVLDDTTRAEVESTARRLRSRAGYVGDFLVVALAGGTGSGKSSLLNALVSETVVTVGAVRPTTSTATAVIPALASADLSRLMVTLNVDAIVRCESLSRTIFVDLPDFDSVETAHRVIVEKVLPNVDAVLWVFDPEKYADPVVHEAFLSRLTAYEDQFIFVLNQTDRLGDDAPAVGADLERQLTEDGYERPEVVHSVATDGAHINELETAVANRFNLKTTAVAKAAVDLQISANGAWRACRDARALEDDTQDPYVRALAEATFVLLGVEAYDFRYSIKGTTDG